MIKSPLSVSQSNESAVSCQKGKISRLSVPIYGNMELCDEVIASIREDRLNTKRVLLAEINLSKTILNQYSRLISIYEKEIMRTDILDKRRLELIEKMNGAVNASASFGADSGDFIDRQIEHSHKIPLKIFYYCGTIILI